MLHDYLPRFEFELLLVANLSICAPLLQRHQFLLSCNYCPHRKSRDINLFCFEFYCCFLRQSCPHCASQLSPFCDAVISKQVISFSNPIYSPISLLYACNILSASAIYNLSNTRRRKSRSLIGVTMPNPSMCGPRNLVYKLNQNIIGRKPQAPRVWCMWQPTCARVTCLTACDSCSGSPWRVLREWSEYSPQTVSIR